MNEGKSANTYFINAKQWIAKTFKDNKKNIIFEDDSLKRIILSDKELIRKETDNDLFPRNVEYYIKYTLTIDCKDEKYRLKFEDIEIQIDESFYIDGYHSNTFIKPYEEIAFYKDEELTKRIAEIKEKIKELQNIDNELVKKKEKKKIEKDIKNLNKNLSDIVDVININTRDAEINNLLIRNYFCNIINNISSAIKIEDDF